MAKRSEPLNGQERSAEKALSDLPALVSEQAKEIERWKTLANNTLDKFADLTDRFVHMQGRAEAAEVEVTRLKAELLSLAESFQNFARLKLADAMKYAEGSHPPQDGAPGPAQVVVQQTEAIFCRQESVGILMVSGAWLEPPDAQPTSQRLLGLPPPCRPSGQSRRAGRG